MNIIRELAFAPFTLVCGVLLMTIPGPPLDASDSDPVDTKGALTLTDFSAHSPDLHWYVQNDNVMGGRSKGGFEIKEQGALIFAGSTNTNGGGFSSIRTKPFQLDLSNYDGIRLRVKGDGRRYTWQLQTSARYRRYPVSYWAEFDTLDGEWSTVDIPFADFYPQIQGFRLEGPALDPGDITELGLYIYDKKDGPFELRLASVAAYAADPPGTSSAPSE